MKSFDIHRDGWLESILEDDDGEGWTLARIRISVGDVVVTRNLSARGGGDSDSINIPLLPLAQFLAEYWWPLLYEPFRSGAGPAFKARHRLDVPMHGYVFPQLAICSGGDETLLTAWAQASQEYARIQFLSSASTNPEILARDQTEDVLMDLVETVIDRLDSKKFAKNAIISAWDRIRDSLSDLDEFAYCKAAGRLGFDPYDPSSPDLIEFTRLISQSVFEDIADAAFIEELLETTKWVHDVAGTCRDAPRIDVATLGELPHDQLDLPPWEVGARAAEAVRNNAGFTRDRPRTDLEQLFGEVLLAKNASFRRGPPSISALVVRDDRTANLATIARSAREQRFKVCAAAYIAWTSMPGQDRATTPAFTRRQQIARSFAAELLAPRYYLEGRAPKHGFTSDQIESIAGELICPYETVMWQAYHAGIPLRGIEIPAPQHPEIV
jgi:hypothetical protein